MWRIDSLEKTLMLGKTEGRRRRGRQRMRWLDGITDSMDMGLSKLGRWWRTGRTGVLQSVGHKEWDQTIATNCANSFLVSEHSSSFMEHPFYGRHCVKCQTFFGWGVQVVSSVVFIIFLLRNPAVIPSSKFISFLKFSPYPLVSPFC